MSSGFGLGFLPAFVLKFPLKSHLSNLIEGDAELAKPGIEKRVAEVSRHDLLDLCLERGIGHPQWPRPKLQQSLKEYTKQIDEIYTTLQAQRPSPDFEVDPFRVRLALFALHCVTSTREVEVGSMTRALYAGNNKPSLGF